VRIRVVAVGKLKDQAARMLADDYLGRIRHFIRCDEVQVRDDNALRRAVPREATIVALEVDGDQIDSRELARRVERWGRTGKGDIAFVIGGAEGIPADLSREANVRLGLSSLTLPHRLARVVLLEQIYRALTIIRNTPYARED
jgi:23S rRNA (pseudouridine1915-N3)-methyltransferase